MKRMLTVSLVLVGLSFSILSFSIVHANYGRVLHPSYADCNAFCYAWQWWNGSAAYGVEADLEMNGLNHFNNTGSSEQKFLAGWNAYNGTDGYGAVHAGEEVDAKYSGLCNQNGSTEKAYWFAEVWNTSNHVISAVCQAMNTGDFAKPALIIIKHFVSGGGGVLVNMYGYASDTFADYIYYSQGAPTNYDSIGGQEQIRDYVTGHEVWGLYNYGWEWLNSSGTFAFVNRGPDGRTFQDPAQMQWLHDPSPNYTGGEGIQCDYESGVSCTHLG